jgi:hypothetical protein
MKADNSKQIPKHERDAPAADLHEIGVRSVPASSIVIPDVD